MQLAIIILQFAMDYQLAISNAVICLNRKSPIDNPLLIANCKLQIVGERICL